MAHTTFTPAELVKLNTLLASYGKALKAVDTDARKAYNDEEKASAKLEEREAETVKSVAFNVALAKAAETQVFTAKLYPVFHSKSGELIEFKFFLDGLTGSTEAKLVLTLTPCKDGSTKVTADKARFAKLAENDKNLACKVLDAICAYAKAYSLATRPFGDYVNAWCSVTASALLKASRILADSKLSADWNHPEFVAKVQAIAGADIAESTETTSEAETILAEAGVSLV